MIRRMPHLAAAILGLGLLTSPLLSLSAAAHTGDCRADVNLKLSNGKQLQLTANINDSATDVSKVTYTVNVPVGVTVTRIVYSGGSFTGKENVQWTATNAANTYTSTYVVSTGLSNVAVGTLSVLAWGSTDATISSTSAHGVSNQPITATNIG